MYISNPPRVTLPPLAWLGAIFGLIFLVLLIVSRLLWMPVVLL
ncbi:TPA: hypothetical protein ACXZV3_002528 [Salmonella enterica]